MTPSINRYKDIVLNPCNRSVERRNTAAIRDALQALAEQQPEATPSSGGGGSQLVFFEVQADAVGNPSVAVKEMIYDTIGGTWGATGADYTAYDWTGSQNVNFRTGALGFGRINTQVAVDALEVMSIEGVARVIEVSLTENMGMTTTKQAAADVDAFWGDLPNGRDPGASVIIHDITNMAPAATMGSKALAIWDEKRQIYVMVAPWNGLQPPGQAAVVEIAGGDAELGCDDSVEEDSYCLYKGNVLTVAVPTTLCDDKFVTGAPIWVVDGRNCHGNSRLNHQERYIAVSSGIIFDPHPGGPLSDERTIYVVVEYSPSFRWFRVLRDNETLGFAEPEPNDLTCREHDCGGDRPDDAPSAWAVWEDINPCTRVVQVIDGTYVLLYFTMYRSRCKPAEEQTDEEKCQSRDANPSCRKDQHILGWWNPVSERWEAVADSTSCERGSDMAFVYVCEGDAYLDCCLFDSIKITFWPRNESYCDPVRDIEPVWARCTNGQVELPDGWCKLGVRICDALECTFGNPPKTETRPVYLIECGPCDVCTCPSTETNVVRYKLRVENPFGPCSFIDGIAGEMKCLDENPFNAAHGSGEGWYAIINIPGLTPKLMYHTTPWDKSVETGYPDGAWLEISCGGEAYFPGQVIAAYNELEAQINTPTPNDYEIGIDECRPMHVMLPGQDRQLYRPRNYAYGLWMECLNGNLINFYMYMLNFPTTTVPRNPICSDDGPRQIPTVTQILGEGEDLQTSGKCCANWQVACFPDIVMACKAGIEIPIPDLGGALSGETTCSPCSFPDPNHLFGGCPCDWITTSVTKRCVAANSACGPDPYPTSVFNQCCSHPDNKICIEFEWPIVIAVP